MRHLQFWMIIIAFIGSNNLLAQGTDIILEEDSIEYTEILDQAHQLIVSFKNDSVLELLDPVLEELEAEEQLETPLGLKIHLAYATALEHDEQDSLAMQLLLQIRESSQEKELWKTYAETCIALANLHETIELEEESLDDLRRAQTTLKLHGLREVYPRFSVRMSSWHRIFGDKDSALYYAQEVLKTAPEFGQILEKAIGHMLMNLLISKEKPDEALAHCQDAIVIYQQLDDFTGCSFLFNSITKIYVGKDEYNTALRYNDSIIYYAHKSISQGHGNAFALYNAYKFRAEIYRELGRNDSAWYYLKAGTQLELEDLSTQEKEKVVEIEARYNDEKKAQRIEVQSQLIQVERTRRNILMMMIFVVSLLVIGLLYFYQQLRKVNRKIRSQSEQLKNLDKVKSRFFANVSHELRTPLTLMLGPINTLLKENRLADKQVGLLKMAHRSGKQLENLVNEILDLRKLELGKIEIKERPTRLRHFFRRHIGQFDSWADQKQINFHISIEIAEKTIAAIDHEKCRQILYNLLSNAFKFTPHQGEINGTVSLKGDQVELEIIDSGPGIHADDLPHIFERFFQTSQPDKPAEGGTGIGLAICQEYVQLMGGDIRVESEMGVGTTFQLNFPITLLDDSHPVEGNMAAIDDEENHWHDKGTIISAKKTTNKPRILVVEDNIDLQSYIELVLSKDYDVELAENGKIALDRLIQNGNYQLVLSDLMMPVMDGYQLLTAMKSKSETRHLPVVMLTARAQLSNKLNALRIGVDDYMSKPFHEEELLARIKNLLGNQKIRAEEIPPEAKIKRPVISQDDQNWLTSFENYLKEHFNDPTLSVPGLAEEFAMSESTLLRNLKRLTGLTPRQYIKEIRLDTARKYLENQSYKSVSKIAQEVGYNDSRAFSRSFRKRFGKLPSDMMIR